MGRPLGRRRLTLASGSTTSHTIPSLVNGTEYTVRVTATRTDANDGPPSAEKTGTPAAPTAPGVTVSKTALTVTEQDTTGNSYTVVLDTQPTADVVVTVAGHAGTDVTATPNLLTFTATNWNTAQTVTVKAGDDADLVNETVTLTHSAVSTDTVYNGIPIAAVTVTVNDNDRSNTPPVFTGGTTQTRTLAETMGGARAGTAAAIGDPVAATDADDEPLTYSLGGTDAGKFDFLASSAQLRTKANERYDFEAQPSYAVTVTVTVDDGTVSVSAAVTISLTDVDEPPLAPAAPTVTATPNATDSLSVSWSAPSNTGRPAIDSYDLQYREGTTGTWTDGPQNVSGTSTTIAGLAADPAAYQVQVRATNDEGDGPWSPTGRIGGGGGGARNDPPLAVDDAAETVDGTAVFIDVLANDSDPNGDTLTVVEVSAPAHGTAVVAAAAAGTVEYTPEADFHGTDRFTYVVGDGSGLTARAAVEVTVLPVNDPPLAVDDAAETVEGTAVFIDVLANDSDPNGDTLTVVEVSAPAHGTAVAAAAGTVEYTPEADFHGTDRFTYVVGDGSGLTARAAVEVTVLPVNDPPLAVDDVAETVEGTAVFIDVLANDSDPNGDTLTVVEVSAPAHGTAVVAAAGTVEYTPGPDFHGTDRLTYVVGDGSGLTARAAVEVTVLPVNDPPLAGDDAADTPEDTSVTIDVLANDSDPNGDTLTVVEVSAPVHGTAVVAAAGTVEYTPEPDFHGTDRLTYVVGDGSGLTARAAVEVTVLPVNDPPLAGDDAADTPEDTSVTIAVLANDSDPNGDTLTVVEVSTPVHGTAVVAAAGTVEYTLEPDFHGTDRLTYVVGDGSGLTARAAVEVTVLPVNDPPLAGDDAADTPEDTSVTIAVLRNDSDGDGDALALVEASAPAHGSARLTDAGAVEYTLEPDFHGTDRLTYVVGDGSGLTARAAVEVTVLPVNDPPLATGVIPDQTLDVGDGPAVLDLIPFFEDRDGDALGYTAVVSDQAVAVSLTGATLTLTATRLGTATVTVTAQDPGGLTATQAFLVTTTDHQARGVVEDTLAALGRGHLASARATLGRRVETTGQEESQVTVAGLHVPLGTGVAAAGWAVAERWITGVAGGMPLQSGGRTGMDAAPGAEAVGAPGALGAPAARLGMAGGAPFGEGASPTRSNWSPLSAGGQTEFLLALGRGQAGGGAAPGPHWTVWGAA